VFSIIFVLIGKGGADGVELIGGRKEVRGGNGPDVVIRRAELRVPILQQLGERYFPFERVGMPAGIGGEGVNPARQPYRL
jgi:hypothetical protein